MSFVESVANVFIGFLVALITQIIVFPLLDIYVRMTDNIMIALIFTIVSIIRSYALRRLFNGR